MQQVARAEGDSAQATLSGARIYLVAEPSPSIRAVEEGLRSAGAAVLRPPRHTASSVRPDRCDVVVVHIQGDEQVAGRAAPALAFPAERTLLLVDEASPERLPRGRDFVLPPFRPAEVVMRVARMLQPISGLTYAAGNLRLHTASRTVDIDDTAVDLTFHEFEIMRLLLAAQGTVLSRDDMVRHLARDAAPDSRWVDIHIHRLRTKLHAMRGASIETVRGVGYRLRI
jgi:hypothetical protein